MPRRFATLPTFSACLLPRITVLKLSNLLFARYLLFISNLFTCCESTLLKSLYITSKTAFVLAD